MRQGGIRSIAMPALGCGNGGLEWSDGRELIKNALAPIADKVRILVYAPEGQKQDAAATRMQKRELKPVLAALLCFVGDYMQIEPELTMQDIQHLSYVLAAAGCGRRKV